MWRAVGRSVRGASHRRRGLPNQDAVGWAELPNGEFALAVADGHGSAACFRSATGAGFAVAVALEMAVEFRGRLDFTRHYLDDIESEVKQRLVSRWRAEVARDLLANPFTDAEIAILESRQPRTPWTAYGSTLLVAIASERRLFLLQIGDGDILLVSPLPRVFRPWPRDPRFLGVETASLCTIDAESNIRVRVEPFSNEYPRLVILCTDGYPNSFRADSGFLKVGSDLLEIIDDSGLDQVDQDLEGWLEEASSLGSGDDVTLGLLFRDGAGRLAGSINGS